MDRYANAIMPNRGGSKNGIVSFFIPIPTRIAENYRSKIHQRSLHLDSLQYHLPHRIVFFLRANGELLYFHK